MFNNLQQTHEFSLPWFTAGRIVMQFVATSLFLWPATALLADCYNVPHWQKHGQS